MAQTKGGGSNDNSAGNNGGGGGSNDNNAGNNGGGGGNNRKGQSQEVQVQPHPVKEQLPGVQYCINSPPPWRPYILFFTCFLVICHFCVATKPILLWFC